MQLYSAKSLSQQECATPTTPAIWTCSIASHEIIRSSKEADFLYVQSANVH